MSRCIVPSSRATASRGEAQALDLGLDVRGGDVVVGDVEPARRDKHGPADRDAAGNGQAEELEAHGIDAISEGAMRHHEHDARQPRPQAFRGGHRRRDAGATPTPRPTPHSDATPRRIARRPVPCRVPY
jgi:hypothetical protein